MKRQPRISTTVPMSPDAYAGFLKLLLTPLHRVPEQSGDIDAYLQYATRREPLPDSVKLIIGHPTVEAA